MISNIKFTINEMNNREREREITEKKWNERECVWARHLIEVVCFTTTLIA